MPHCALFLFWFFVTIDRTAHFEQSKRGQVKSCLKLKPRPNVIGTLGWWRGKAERSHPVATVNIPLPVSLLRELFSQCGVNRCEVATSFHGRTVRKLQIYCSKYCNALSFFSDSVYCANNKLSLSQFSHIAGKYESQEDSLSSIRFCSFRISLD